MNKKILIVILVVGLILVVGFALWALEKAESSEFSKQELLQKFQTLRIQYKQVKAEGYDVTETKALARQAKQAYNKGNYKKANEFLNKAFKALEKAKISIATPTPSTSPSALISPIIGQEKARKRLSEVKVGAVYERLTDGTYLLNRRAKDVAGLLKEIKTDFVFRGWWRFHPAPESPTDNGKGFFTSEDLLKAKEQGYTYEDLRNGITEIKKKNPDIIIVGAIGAQFLHAKKDRNPMTGEILDKDRTWSMAVGPQKWGLKISKEEFLQEFGSTHSGYSVNGPFYYPDITNPEFQELILSWAEKQIDSGVGAIWIDLLYSQAMLFDIYARKNPSEAENALKASKESYEASSKMIDEIHAYGYSKHGKYIYVGTWESVVSFPYAQPKLDFVTQNIMSQEVKSMNFNNNRWNNTINDVKSKLGDIPIFAVLDWSSGTGTGLGVFSQTLTSEQQKGFLKTADDFLTKKGIIFLYPIHGGNMGKDAKTLSFGKYPIYDSLAPEFNTYETIKKLAQRKAGK